MAVPRPSVNYSASDTKCLQYIGCFYSPIRRRNNAVLLWRALKERKERAGLEFPALQQKRLLQENPVHKWQAPGELGPVLSSLRNPAETARSESLQQVGRTPRMTSSRKDKAAVNPMSGRQMGTAWPEAKPCPRMEH